MVNGFASKGDLVFKTEYELRMKFSLDILYGNLIKTGKFFLNIFTNKIFYFLLVFFPMISGRTPIFFLKVNGPTGPCIGGRIPMAIPHISPEKKVIFLVTPGEDTIL